MKLTFLKVKLHNFLSYIDAEFDLKDKGYCLVSGVNNFAKNCALSNGAGKSTWVSAICYALTGETIQGVSKDLLNHYAEDDTCSVQLDFIVNNDYYTIIRYHKPKSDLKIFINNEDKSGKGIRDSEVILGNLLPDLNKDLLAAVILLGQGLPNKLTARTPSGRKELLEKLSKSDFMIEDIKARILKRQEELSTELRKIEDESLVNNVNLQSTIKLLDQATVDRDSRININYDEDIKLSKDNITKLEKSIEENINQQKQIDNIIESISNKIIKLADEKQECLKEEYSKYSSNYNELTEAKSIINSQIVVLNNEIKRVSEIKDVCPTCGRPFENIQKPDLTETYNKLDKCNADLVELNKQILDCSNKHNTYLVEINTKYNPAVFQTELTSYKTNKNLLLTAQTSLNLALNEELKRLATLESNKKDQETFISNINNKINTYTNEINKLSEKIKNNEATKLSITEHISVVKKLDTFAKRDFRGYLLKNVISYINKCAKDYCEIITGTREIEVYLDGNALDISYCGVILEGLSGGERTKVDLILQLALRNMLQTYLNFSSNIIVLDEVTDFLDKQGCTKVMNLIEKELNDLESVFIISHHVDELNITYDSELKIVKNQYGISEVK